MAPEPTESDYLAEFPGWTAERGTDQRLHGRRLGPGAALRAVGDTWQDLIDDTHRSERLLDPPPDPPPLRIA